MAASPTLGVCFDRSFPPAALPDFARHLEDGGADQLWVIEDCFYTTAVTLAAAALTATERLTVGLGILPAVARNPAITAMELSTLARLAPGRLIAGIGHGVQDWMAQIGARPASPLTALEEVITVVRRLLRGEQVTFHGSSVDLDAVTLDHAPEIVPPVVAGVRGRRSLAMAGRCADGLVLAEFSGPAAIGSAISLAAPTASFGVTVYTVGFVDRDRTAARAWVAPWLAEMVAAPPPGLRAAECFDDVRQIVERSGPDGLVRMPDAYWTELCAVGTPDDAREHVEALASAGAEAIAFFPSPQWEEAVDQVDRLLRDVIAP